MISLPDYSTRELARRIVLASVGFHAKNWAPEDLEDILDRLVPLMAWAEKPVLPEPNESCVVAPDCPKTAALFFDRIWLPPNPRLPEGIGFYGATDLEIWMTLIAQLPRSKVDLISISVNSPLWDLVGKLDLDLPLQISAVTRILASEIQNKLGSQVIPMYDSFASSMNEYKVGDKQAFLASIVNLEVIDEQKLTWTQVKEIREDDEALAKIRNLRHWFDSEMAGKPISFVTDAVGKKLDDYRWSLKKHGLSTVIGSLQSILDPKFMGAVTGIGAIVAAMANGEWAVATTGIAVAGKTVLSVGEKFLDLASARKGDGAEVAFINDVMKLQEKNS